ncbi:hypothetical protein [Micromonospora kangleipakensis]|uniref:hypothetical protein n=1 Tax=Micromonospora kangleipakensis TaxID=1077942 RepID=UPI0013EF3A64|nr:hypothetical protein [Micromonospora kangleipakensis]
MGLVILGWAGTVVLGQGGEPLPYTRDNTDVVQADGAEADDRDPAGDGRCAEQSLLTLGWCYRRKCARRLTGSSAYLIGASSLGVGGST